MTAEERYGEGLTAEALRVEKKKKEYYIPGSAQALPRAEGLPNLLYNTDAAPVTLQPTTLVHRQVDPTSDVPLSLSIVPFQ